MRRDLPGARAWQGGVLDGDLSQRALVEVDHLYLSQRDNMLDLNEEPATGGLSPVLDRARASRDSRRSVVDRC